MNKLCALRTRNYKPIFARPTLCFDKASLVCQAFAPQYPFAIAAIYRSLPVLEGTRVQENPNKHQTTGQ